MKKTVYTLIIITFCLLVLTTVLRETKAFYEMIVETLYLWLTKVFPSIFIFYLISSAILNFGLAKYLFYPIIKISFFLKNYSITGKEIFYTSILVGNPSSASLISECYQNNKISRQEAQNLLKISSFVNPLFIYSCLISFSPLIRTVIIVIHILSNVIVSLFIKTGPTFNNYDITFVPLQNISNIFKSIENVMWVLLYVAGIMVFFNCIKYSLSSYIDNATCTVLLSSLEVSSGIIDLINLNISNSIKLSLISFLLGFSSFSIIFQALNVIDRNIISLKSFFIARLLQGIIASFLTFMILLFI